ncbi:MAG: hypothetical protein HYY18_10505 [Planctomycetes bacterium]|nr:hypothetical protein [Planctomycetota bacterium]
MSDDPRAPGVPDDPRARFRGRIVLAKRFSLDPGEQLRLDPFVLAWPRLLVGLETDIAWIHSDGKVWAWFEGSDSPGNWSPHPAGRWDAWPGIVHFAAVALVGRRTRVVLENAGDRPAVVASIALRLVAAREIRSEENRHVG